MSEQIIKIYLETNMKLDNDDFFVVDSVTPKMGNLLYHW